MNNQVYRKGRSDFFRIGSFVGSQLLGNLRQPLVQLFQSILSMLGREDPCVVWMLPLGSLLSMGCRVVESSRVYVPNSFSSLSRR